MIYLDKPQINGVADPVNSTVATLGNGGVFNGDWVDTINVSTLIISIKSDQASATDGLCIDWGDDGVTKVQDDVFTISANVGKVFTFSPAGRYMRIIYTNGTTPQTSFSLQVTYKKSGFKASSHRIQDTIIGEDDASLIKANLTGLADDGTYKNLRMTNDGLLWSSSKPYQYDVSEGNIEDIISVSKFGHNNNVGSVLEEVWDGSAVYVYMTSPSTLYISSSDAGDDQDYEVQGLDENWQMQTVTVTANGQNFVALSGSWIRVYRAKNLGSTNNAGTIYISDDNTDVGGNGIPDDLTAVKAQITVGFNQTLMAMWSCPDTGLTAYLTEFYGSTSSSKATGIYLFVRPFGGVFQIKKIITVFEGTASIGYNYPLVVAGKSDVVIKSSVPATGGQVSAGFDLYYK